MVKEKRRNSEINLLAVDELENRPGGIFLRWALSWGKKIIIVTEIVVIGAFLSRFWLDTRLADLTDQIGQKRVAVMAEADFEKEFRAFTKRLSTAEKIEKLVSPMTIMAKAQSFIPSGVEVSQMGISGKVVTFIGTCDETKLGQMVNQFKSSDNFTDIFVEKISQKSDSPLIDFSLRGTYAKK